MNRTGIIIAVGGLFVALGIVLTAVLWLTPDAPRSEQTSTDVESVPENEQTRPPPFLASEAMSGTPEEARTPPVPERTEEVRQSESSFIAGQVIDLITRQPVPDFHVELRRVTPGRGGWGRLASQTFHDEEGRFSIPIRHGGFHDLLVFSSRHRLRHLKELEVDETTGLAGVLVEVDPGDRVTGRVIDDRDGSPIADARVLAAGAGRETVLIHLLTVSGESTPHVRTDSLGRFVLTGLASQPLEVAAVHPDYVVNVVPADPSTGGEVEIRLAHGFHIHGTTSDDEGRPVAGVLVQMSSPGARLLRPVMSGAAGDYRLPPASPGPVYLRARTPPGHSGPSLHFTEETREVEIVDADLRVDFGPSTEHVTWKGRLLGPDGEPIASASVSLAAVRMGARSPPEMWVYWMERTDSKGRFLFSKLPCGRHEVTLYLPDNRRLSDWDQIVFREPGPVERDLRLGGGTIEGVIVDGVTGMPVDPEGGFVFVIEQGRSRSFSAQLDEESRFVLAGLPASTWNLTASIEGYPTKKVHRIEVQEGRTNEPLRLEVLAGGYLGLQVTGFGEGDPQSFQLHMQREDDVRYSYGSFSLEQEPAGLTDVSTARTASSGPDPSGGAWNHRFELAVGSWTAELSFDGLAHVERSFQIAVGETTEVVVRGEDLATVHSSVTVAGRLHHADGAPVAGAHLIFFATSVPDIDPAGTLKRGTTDAAGGFAVAGFRPGRWSVQARLAEGGEPVFPDLVVAQNSEDPLPLDLVLPAGTVRGTLVDRRTGHPFDDEGPVWWVFLTDTTTLRTVAELQGGHRGRSFQLVGVPSGSYRLRVKARGHEVFEIPSLAVGPPQVVDVGELALAPCGVLELEVLDAAGQRVTSYRVLIDGGRALGSAEGQLLENGVRRFDWLPLGSVDITVAAEGFPSRDVPAELRPGQPARIRVILEPPPR